MNVKMQIEHTESDGWAKLGQILLRWARNRSERRILENTDGQITDDGKEASNAIQTRKTESKTTILRDLRRVLPLMPWRN